MPSKIEWTNETWNPVSGCSKVSPGCAHCYAAGGVAVFVKQLGGARPGTALDDLPPDLRVREWPGRYRPVL